MNDHDVRRSWQVLLIGGASGTGKSTAAEAVGRQLGVPWLQVDDLRLVLQYGGFLSPEQQPDLFYFLQIEDVLRETTERLLKQLITVADQMAEAIENVIGHHVATGKPVIIEGDGIAPDFVAKVYGADVRAVFLVESDREALYRNMLARGRGVAAERTPETEERARAWAGLAWQYNQWLECEARRYGLPVVAPQPYATLAERIIAASQQ